MYYFKNSGTLMYDASYVSFLSEPDARLHYADTSSVVSLKIANLDFGWKSRSQTQHKQNIHPGRCYTLRTEIENNWILTLVERTRDEMVVIWNIQSKWNHIKYLKYLLN